MPIQTLFQSSVPVLHSASVPSFPLAVDASGRFLKTAGGQPFFFACDSMWSLPVATTRSQIVQYLNDRQSRGFNATLINLIEHRYNPTSPVYRNQEGNDPFTTVTLGTSVSWTSRVTAYWDLVDYIATEAANRGMAVLAFPAFWGFSSNTQGWDVEVNAATAADLQNYGTYLGQRFGGRNFVWAKGGDNDMSTGTRAQQDNIFTGIVSQDANAIFTAETYGVQNSGPTDAKVIWGTDINLNSIYDYSGSSVTIAAAAYSRVAPFFLIESQYEGFAPSLNHIRQQHWTTVLSGGCGSTFGNVPLWDLGDPIDGGGIGAQSALDNHMNTPGAQHFSKLISLITSYPWQLLQPKTDTSLVTTTLGASLAPARASDGSFAMIYWNTGASITVAMSAITHGSVRARLYDPTTGNFSTIAGSPFANSGTQTFTYPGANAAGDTDWVVVLD